MQAVEMSYLKSACGVNRMDGMSNESVYEQMEETKMTTRVYVRERERGREF